MDMVLAEAKDLAHSINEREGQFHASAFDIGTFALVALRDRLYGNHSRYPIRDPLHYLREMEAGSMHVESDLALQEVLRQWLRENEGRSQRSTAAAYAENSPM